MFELEGRAENRRLRLGLGLGSAFTKDRIGGSVVHVCGGALDTEVGRRSCGCA